MFFPAFLGVVAVLVTPLALWVWRWRPVRWNRLRSRQASGRLPGSPYAGAATVPAFAVATWLAALCALIAATLFRGAPDLPFLLVPLAPYVLPVAVFVAGRPSVLVPPGARRAKHLGR